jgi:YggT family protein
MQFFLVSFIGILLDIVSFAIVARILLSWIQSPGAGRFKMFLYDATEPILAPFRRSIFRIGVIDISPIIVLVLLDLCKSLLICTVNYLFMAL